ncbi:MAG: xylan 1,4-beta-xylosidase, partial [Verrucomicrobiota bacterium]|nr:xylan 1,4-beta-xylosidase [Verrucomicrobiota bacterium]
IMVWHYHDDDLAGPAAEVELTVDGLPAGLKSAQLSHHRVDEFHSNSYGEWKRLGSPLAPNRKQYDQLLASSELAVLTDATATVAVANGQAELKFPLPRQGVSLLTLDWSE